MNERKERKQEVTHEISNKWSSAQNHHRPVFDRTYTEIENNVPVNDTCNILPENLDVQGRVEPEIRYRSIYKVPVYTARPLVLKGRFSKHNLSPLNISPEFIRWSDACLCIGITDLKGLKEQAIKWNNQLLTMEAGMPDNSIADQGSTLLSAGFLS